MLTVAIASEHDAYDAEVYRLLLERLLGTPVEKWKTEMRFGGDGRVFALAEPFLKRAADAGVRHALLAVDNDGGSKRRPEHLPTHDVAGQAADTSDGCRVCRLQQALPGFWTADGRNHALIVPVQTLETWLLCLRGDPMVPSPEQVYDRPTLKKRFFGKPVPSLEKRIELASKLLESDQILGKLQERSSFRHFAEQVKSWSIP